MPFFRAVTVLYVCEERTQQMALGRRHWTIFRKDNNHEVPPNHVILVKQNLSCWESKQAMHEQKEQIIHAHATLHI